MPHTRLCASTSTTTCSAGGPRRGQVDDAAEPIEDRIYKPKDFDRDIVFPQRDTLVALFELQAQLDRFVSYYDAARPHRALGRRTPAEVFDAKIKGSPRRARARYPLPGPPRQG